MTRTPRSRTKKVATPPPTKVAAEAVDLTSPQGALPIDSMVVAVAGTPPSVEIETAATSSAVTNVVESVLLPVRAERGSMRIEVSEDRSLLGQRLRAAREVRGWSSDDVAHRLHVPTSVINDIEAERFDRLGAPIYLRGYLGKYASLVELPQVVVNRALEGYAEPLLKASTESPRVVANWERYRVAVIGAVITLAVAIPVLTLVAGRGINSPVPQVRSLDESDLGQTLTLPVAQLPLQEDATNSPAATPVSAASNAAAGALPPAVNATPVEVADAAAVSPLPLSETAGPAPTTEANPALLASMTGFNAPPVAGGHIVEATFREDSWIEIFDQDGRVIEQNLVRAGETRRYESTGVVSVKVGNVGGVELRADGNLIDLSVHARANVARLRLFEATPTP